MMDKKLVKHHRWLNGKERMTIELISFLFRNVNEHKLSWKVPYIFDGTGTLSATMKVTQTMNDGIEGEQQQQQAKPLTTSSIVHVQFLGENALFSSIDFEFACRGYRISLLKKKISSGQSLSPSLRSVILFVVI